MTINGSGKFVSIAASSTVFPFIPSEDINGIVFGNGNREYGSIAARYILNGNTVTDTALCVDTQATDNFYLNLNNLQRFTINGNTGYTGDVTFATSTYRHSSTGHEVSQYAVAQFVHGFLKLIQ